MTTSLIIGIVVILAAFIWYIRSLKKARHHLDDLHITAEGRDEKE